MNVVVAGAHGFIGSRLVPFLQERGHTVCVLSRSPKAGEFFWDPQSGQLTADHLEHADCLINLAGESIVGRWNQEKMERIRKSRFETSELLVRTVMQLNNPPKIFIGASAIGYYGDRGEERLTENSLSGHGYLAEVARLWEEIPKKMEAKGVRVVAMRLGVVLGKEGGALSKMLPSFRLGFAGTLGSGKQWMSWVSIQDVCAAFEFVMQKEIAGPVNCVAPGAVTNYDFTKTLGRLLHRPTALPLPEFLLKLLFGSGAEIFLASLHVVPEKLEHQGFQFEHADLESALRAQCVAI